MFTTPQKRATTTTTTSYKSPAATRVLANTKGLFSDGIWHCNCTPRLPATHFQVKKEGRNKNRWFYTCQTNKEDGGCGFFLWQEEAQTREGKAVMNNSRSEAEVFHDGRTPLRGNGENTGKSISAGRANDILNSSATARAENSTGSSDDFGEWLSPSDGKKMVQANDVRYSSPPWPETEESEQPSTPSRKSIKSSEFNTPGSKRKRNFVDEIENDMGKGLPTPVTGGGRVRNASEYGYNDSDPFSTPSSLRTASASLFGIRSPSHTPQPSHMRQPDYPDLPLPQASDSNPPEAVTRDQEPAISTTTSSNIYDITPDVMSLLQEEGIQLDTGVEHKLKNLLGKHAMRVSGIAKGRDITRVALKSKDLKIAELGVRIGQLETEREVDRRVLRSLRGSR